MEGKTQKPDRRKYTLMLVPHDGRAVHKIYIPIKTLKYGLAVMCILMVMVLGTFVKYHSAAAMAQQEQSELKNLRQTNADQAKQIDDLAKSTATLQQEMDKVNALDAEVRRILSGEEPAETSRAGTNRPAIYTGQGGPVAKPDLKQLALVVEDLQQQAAVREQSLSELKDALAARNARLKSTPSIWPTGGDVTSRFGWRSSPWGGGGSDWHPGIDIANSSGTAIVATADGVVTYSGWYSGYGRLVKISHGNGIETLYGHCSELLVGIGEKITRGQLIARMGSTGDSTGSHLHYEVRVNGTAVNPASFLQ